MRSFRASLNFRPSSVISSPRESSPHSPPPTHSYTSSYALVQTDARGEGPAYAIFSSKNEEGYEEAPALGWTRASPFFFLWFLYKGIPENPLPSQSLESDIPDTDSELRVPVEGGEMIQLCTTAVGFDAAEPDTAAWLRLRYHYLVHAIG